MQQYFTDELLQIDMIYKLNQDVKHHFIKVLRMRKDDIFYLVDKTKTRYCLKLINSDEALVYKEENYNAEMPVKIRILQALIKRDKLEYFLMKATELGVNEIVFFESKRTIVNIEENQDKKLERWKKLCFEAACQSKRNIIPSVLPVISFNELTNYKSDLNIVFYEDINYESKSIKEVLKKQETITFVIGPEGGFDIGEITSLVNDGFIPCKLSNRILRAETASLYGLSVVSGLIEE